MVNQKSLSIFYFQLLVLSACYGVSAKRDVPVEGVARLALQAPNNVVLAEYDGHKVVSLFEYHNNTLSSLLRQHKYRNKACLAIPSFTLGLYLLSRLWNDQDSTYLENLLKVIAGASGIVISVDLLYSLVKRVDTWQKKLWATFDNEALTLVQYNESIPWQAVREVAVEQALISMTESVQEIGSVVIIKKHDGSAIRIEEQSIPVDLDLFVKFVQEYLQAG